METKLTAVATGHRRQIVSEPLKTKLGGMGSRRRRADARSAATSEVQRHGLVRLDFSRRTLTSDELAQAIGDLTTHHVQSLNFGATQLDEDKVRRIAKALLTNTSLAELNLFNCGLDSTAVDLLAAALRSHATLRSLTLGCANAAASGGSLAALVNANRGLRWLDLSWSGLDGAALCTIFNALPENTGLDMIRLRGLSIPTEAVSALSAALRRAVGSLAAIDLSGCSIDECDVERLADSVAESGLWAIELKGIPMPASQRARLDRVLSANRGRSAAAGGLSKCLAAERHLPLDLCAEILRHIPLDAEGLGTLRNLRAWAGTSEQVNPGSAD